MPSTTAAGTGLAISAGIPASQNAAGYSALSYTEVGNVEQLGGFGATTEVVSFQPLKGAQQKHKGPTNYGALNPTIALDDADAGQALLAAAAAPDNRALYATRVTKPDGSLRYFQVRVFGMPETIGAANSMITAAPVLEINTPVVKVPSSGSVTPTPTPSPTPAPTPTPYVESGDLFMARSTKIAYFPLDEINGTAFVDKVSSSRQAAIQNVGTGVLLNRPSQILTRSGGAPVASTRPAAGFVLASTGGARIPAASMGAAQLDGTKAFTIRAVINPDFRTDGTGQRYPIFCTFNETAGTQGVEFRGIYSGVRNGIAMHMRGSGVDLRIESFTSGTPFTEQALLTNGQTWHVVATYDPALAVAERNSLFVNGFRLPVSVNTSTFTGTITPVSDGRIGFGNADTTATYFNGIIDELAIDGAAWTYDEVQRDWMATLGRPLMDPPYAAPNLIMDNDLTFDVDGVEAVALAGAMQKAGLANVLLMNERTSEMYGGPFLNLLAKRYGLPSAKITVSYPNGSNSTSSPTAKPVLDRFLPSNTETSANYPEGTAEMRKALAALPDKQFAPRPTRYVGMGSQRQLDLLLNSPADATSPLTGAQLVRAKVESIWLMGGEYPSGSSANFTQDVANTISVFNIFKASMPEMPIIVVPRMVGADVRSGPPASATSTNDPMAYAFELFEAANNGQVVNGKRLAFDSCTVLAASLGTAQDFAFRGPVGEIVIATDGSNTLAANNALNEVMVDKRIKGVNKAAAATALGDRISALVATVYS